VEVEGAVEVELEEGIWSGVSRRCVAVFAARSSWREGALGAHDGPSALLRRSGPFRA